MRSLILDTIRTVSTYAITNHDEFIEKVRAASQIRQAEAAKETKRKLNKNQKRIAELDTIIKKLYESFAVGRLSSFEEDTVRVEQFLALAKKYTDFSELTTPMINEFIDKIIVHAPERVDGDRVQEVEIHLKFIGRFELPPQELTPEEIKRQDQLHRHRGKSRERYQLIKADEHTVGQPFKLTCKCCGKTFESKHSNALFCGPPAGQSITGRRRRKNGVGNVSAKTAARSLPQRGTTSNIAAGLLPGGGKPSRAKET